MSETVTLLPCPFCGGPAKIIPCLGDRLKDGPPFYKMNTRVTCAALYETPTRKCPSWQVGKGEDESALAEAAAAWNTRAALSAMPRPDDALLEAQEEIARLRKALKPDLFWDDNYPETGYSDPWEVVERHPRGEVVPVRLGATLGVRYFANLPAADDADSDDDWEAESDDAEVVEALVKAERARRAALANGEPR